MKSLLHLNARYRKGKNNNFFRHGETYSPEWRAWVHLKGRVKNKNDTRFHVYGARGITVCKRWENSFKNFLSDMGKRPSKSHSIERINNDKGYCPSNCRWATDKEQANNRSSNIKISFKNRIQNLGQWAEELSIGYGKLYREYRKGRAEALLMCEYLRKKS